MIQENIFNAPLALGLPSDDGDILNAKRLFKELERLEEPPHGFSPLFDRPLDETVRTFQQERGLKEDGLITPGGLTNQPEDIIGVSKALGRLGLFNFDKTQEPSPIISRRLVAAIEKLQQDNGLSVTGELKKGDRAHDALMTAVERKLATASDAPRRSQNGSLRNLVQVAQLDGASSSAQPAERRTEGRQTKEDNRSVPPVPTYRKEVFKAQPGEWERWDRNIRALPKVGKNEAHVYREIFAAEGGFRLDPRTKNVLAGITPQTFAALKEPLREKGFDTSGGPRAAAKKDFPAFYRAIFDGELRQVGGSKIFERFGNKDIAAAVGDVLFNHGGPKGTRIIQSAINRVRPGAVQLDGIFGAETLQQALRLDAASITQKQLLDALTNQRKIDTSEKNEWRRFDHFRFRTNSSISPRR